MGARCRYRAMFPDVVEYTQLV